MSQGIAGKEIVFRVTQNEAKTIIGTTSNKGLVAKLQKQLDAQMKEI